MGRVKKEIPKLFANPITLNPDGTIPTAGITDLVTETTYDGNGNVLTVKDPLNRTTTNAYDGRGRLQRVTDAAGNIIEYTYDDSNNKTQETVTELPPSGAPQVFVTKYQYDGQNRVTKVTDPLNHDTLHEYDPRGNRTKVTDVELHVATAEYDLLGRKTKETDANGGVTTYEYDLLGRLTALVDANTNRTEFTYDADGRLKQEKRPDLRLWVYGYDAEGNRTTVTDPNGTVITTTFDPVSRPTQRDVARGAGVLGPTRVTFGLDPLGRITSSSTTGDTANAVESFAYDSLDRLLNEQEQVGSGPNRTVAKAYDAAGNLTGLTYPSGTALTYDIDALNRIAAVKQAGTPIVSYRDVGARLLDRTLANGIVQTWSYDPGRRLNDILSTKGATTVSDISYTLSNLGNKQTITRPDLAKKGTYLFNANSWVTQEALGVPMAGGTPERQTDYVPDKVLNYTQIQERQSGTLIATKTQTVNSRNQYSAFAGATLTYDPNGNLTGGAGLSGTILAYDFENRLKKATLASGTVVENIYDAQGRKVRESTTISGTATATDYVLHGDQVLEQYKGSNFSARYVHGRGIDETVRAELDVDGDGTLETTVFPVQDELGNVERLTDSAGATLERYDYQGYGKPRIFDPSGGSRSASSYGWRWLFQGREYVSVLNAYDFRARELWPDLGRFGQEDPGKFNLRLSAYQSFRGWPQRYGDPLGQYEEDVHHYLTQFLAQAAGFDRRAAARIGFETQELDMDGRSATAPTSVLDHFVDQSAGNLPNMINYHFLSPGQLLARERGIAEIVPLLGDDPLTWQRIGEFMHAWEDSYAHQSARDRRDFQKQYGMAFGHGLVGHTADWTWERPYVAWLMAKTSFEKLKGFCRLFEGKGLGPCAVQPWSAIDKQVHEFIIDRPPLVFGPPHPASLDTVVSYAGKIRKLDASFVPNAGELKKRQNEVVQYLTTYHTLRGIGGTLGLW